MSGGSFTPPGCCSFHVQDEEQIILILRSILIYNIVYIKNILTINRMLRWSDGTLIFTRPGKLGDGELINA